MAAEATDRITCGALTRNVDTTLRTLGSLAASFTICSVSSLSFL